MSEQAPPFPSRSLAVVVLGAGKGTRMRSRTPKVLHGFAGRTLLAHVLAATAVLEPDVTAVVVGHARDTVTAQLAQLHPGARAVVQEQQLGTGHAVRVALEQITPAEADTVLVVPGDTPLLRPETLARLLRQHADAAAAATLLTAELPDPSGYGRVLRSAGGAVARVVEHRDATADELAVAEVAAGVYAFDAALLRDALTRLDRANAQGEEYLPDVVGVLRANGRQVGALLAAATETAGVNDRVQLAAAHRVYNERLLNAHMRAGVRIVDPATTWIDADVRLAPDVTLQPGVVLTEATTVATGSSIGPETSVRASAVGAGVTVSRSVLDGVTVADRCTIGPFAYLRGAAVLGDGVKVGTFVEVKNSRIGAGAKVPHLSYVGDAVIGERTNIGAATIFVNYDGVTKHRSEVGRDARIGSDNTIVAPVHIGDGVYTGAGTVIREDVPPGALAVSMGPQRSIEGWVARKRPDTAAAASAASARPSTGYDRTSDTSGDATSDTSGDATDDTSGDATDDTDHPTGKPHPGEHPT